MIAFDGSALTQLTGRYGHWLARYVTCCVFALMDGTNEIYSLFELLPLNKLNIEIRCKSTTTTTTRSCMLLTTGQRRRDDGQAN